MVQMIFSLRFQSQLRRTRPQLLRGLEKTIIEAIEGYGGKVRIEYKLISAVFNSQTIGFWLDILCVLEAVKDALEKASSELYGHICIMGQDIPEEDIPVLARAENILWSEDEAKLAMNHLIKTGRLKISRNFLWRNKITTGR